MTTKQFKRIEKILQQVYIELEAEALKQGLGLDSAKYDLMLENAQKQVLKKFGFTVEEYNEIKAKVDAFTSEELMTEVEEVKRLLREVGSRRIPTEEEIAKIATKIAKKYVVEPKVINKIVKEVQIQTPPQLVTETIREEYDDAWVRAELGYFADKLNNLEIPEGTDVEKLKEEMRNEFAEQFEHNINVLGMPNFRKLAMGLQAQIDTLGTAGDPVTLAGEDYLTLSGQQITANPIDLDNLSATGTPSSSTYLRGDNTWATIAGGGDMVLADVQTVTGAKTFGSAGAVGKLKIAGTTSGAVTVDTSAVAGTAVVTIPAVTDTLVGKATTDTFTNKTFDADGTGNSITNIENADIKAGAAIAVNKLAALTASEIVITDASGFLASAPVATYPSLTELTYVKGVTSAIQTQIGNKQNTITFGTGVETALGVNVGSAGAFITFNGDAGTPSALVGTNISGTASSLTAGAVTNATLTTALTVNTGTVTLTGNVANTSVLTIGAGAVSVSGSNTGDQDLSSLAPKASPTFTGTVTIPTPFTIGAVSMTSTGTQLNYLNAATGTTGTTSTNLVFSTSPTLVTPILGTPTSGTLTNCTGLPIAGLVASTSTAIGVGSVELGHATDTTLSRVSAGVIAVEGVTIPTISSTNTLTNKRVTPRVSSETSSATPTINTDNVDAHSITALAADITSMTTNLSGTPTNFQKLIIRIKDNGTARAITWGASFEDAGQALPTTTVISKLLTVGFIYNTVTSKWGCVAVANET